ncbi:MAG: hypothetical protein HY910_12515 [Desulfarculus sp.]|nr:hypothetical protein [Desulfarculus sp.]
MDHIKQVNNIRQEIDKLLDNGKSYFTIAGQVEGMPNDYWPIYGPSKRDRDNFWKLLPTELQSHARDLSENLLSISSSIVKITRNAPLVTNADKKDISIFIKTIRAAFFLRKYSHWDDELLHDEGTVLGVQRAGQSDDTPLPPDKALSIFLEYTQRLLDLLDLLSVPDTFRVPDDSPNSIGARIRPNTAFIMMWIDPKQPELDDICDTIKSVFNSFGIRAIRSDDVEHEGIITERILNEISTSEFLIADLTGARPSVYYELGYAHALKRRVIMYRKNGTKLHFDIAGYNCPEYANNRELKEKLERRLEQITNKSSR